MNATFSQHMALAQAWLRYLGRRVTQSQTFALMRKVTAQELTDLLLDRRVPLPLGCA